MEIQELWAACKKENWYAVVEGREPLGRLETELSNKGIVDGFIYSRMDFRVLCRNNKGTRAGTRQAQEQEIIVAVAKPVKVPPRCCFRFGQANVFPSQHLVSSYIILGNKSISRCSMGTQVDVSEICHMQHVWKPLHNKAKQPTRFWNLKFEGT